MCAISTEMCVCFGKGKVKVCAVIRVEDGSLQASLVSKGVHLTVWKPNMRIALV